METIVEAVLAHGKTNPQKLAVALKSQRMTYGELSKRISSGAKNLKENYGIQSGDLVILSAVSKPDFILAMLSVQYLGAVSVPVDKSAKPGNLQELCRFVQPKLVLTDAKMNSEGVPKISLKEFCENAQEAKGSIPYSLPKTDALGEILFTTGSTGKPKGVMLTYEILYANTWNTYQNIGVKAEDCLLLPLPLNHSFGLRVLRAALYAGASVILQNGFTFAKDLEENIGKYQCTALASVPASLEMLSRQMGDRFSKVLGNLRYIEVAAGALPVDMKQRLLALFPKTELYNTWGSTETGGAVFLKYSEHPDKLDTIGRPAVGIDFKTVDLDGNPTEAHDINTAGRMALRGPMQMAGYYKQPELTAETLVDGWLYTNDMVYQDEDGFIHMLGRADDIINVGGEKVSPVEVENTAQQFPGVRECACIGVEDPEGMFGWIPVLYVVPDGAAFEDEALMKFLAGRLERYKLPKQYIPIQELPRNRMQKIDRSALKRQWQETGGKSLMNETIQSIMNRRSIREFTEESIPQAALELILQAGIYAPSGHNMQTWRFTVLREPKQIMQLKEIMQQTAEAKQVYFYGFQNPSAVILVSNDRRNHCSVQDSSCAAQNIMLAAHSLGVGSVWVNAWMTLCDEPEVRALLREFQIPEQHIVWASIALGYPKNPGKLLAKKQNVIRWL